MTKIKLLIFTEHKDTLDYLVAKLQWGLTVAQIHGGMHIGDRDTPGTGCAQSVSSAMRPRFLLPQAAGRVSTCGSAGSRSTDIPWSPVRLEQRMVSRGQDHGASS